MAPVSEILPVNYPPDPPGTQFAISYSANARHRRRARWVHGHRELGLGRAGEAA